MVSKNEEAGSFVFIGASMEQDYNEEKLLKDVERFLKSSSAVLPDHEGRLGLSELLEQLECLLAQDENLLENFRSSDVARTLANIRYTKIIEFCEYATFAMAFCVDEHISTENYPIIFRIIHKWKKDGLDRHNSLGYHYHYYKKVSGEYKQADAMMTFDPDEDYLQYPEMNNVFWERHGSGACVKCKPGEFGQKKRRNIYESMYSFLTAQKKEQFRAPSNHAQILYP